MGEKNAHLTRTDPLANQLSKAYSFHSFNVNYAPSINAASGLTSEFQWRGVPFSRSLKERLWQYSLLLLPIGLTIYFKLSNAPSAALAVSASATIALLSLLVSLEHHKKLAKENNALQWIDKMWAGSGNKTITKKALRQFQINDAQAPRTAINRFRRFQLIYSNKLGQSQLPLYHTVYGAALAIIAQTEVILSTEDDSAWQSFFKRVVIDRESIVMLLNDAEKLCQGIESKIYDEQLVRSYMGSSLYAIVTYLLPYIYAKRELQVLRITRRKHFLQQLPFADKGQYYKSHREEHDFMYEYLEYYCYRWYLSDKPQEFDMFHNRLVSVYAQLSKNFLNNVDNLDASEQWKEYCPIISLTLHQQRAVLSNLTSWVHEDI